MTGMKSIAKLFADIKHILCGHFLVYFTFSRLRSQIRLSYMTANLPHEGNNSWWKYHAGTKKRKISPVTRNTPLNEATVTTTTNSIRFSCIAYRLNNLVYLNIETKSCSKIKCYKVSL